MSQLVTPIPWFEESTYLAARALMGDGGSLPMRYIEWRRHVEACEDEARASGVRVWRAFIDPDAFRFWCDRRGLSYDDAARQRWADEVCVQAHVGRDVTVIGRAHRELDVAVRPVRRHA
jgi:hypothetical protein